MSRARLLIDECLSVELAWMAWERGHEATHLRDRGLLGVRDADLAPMIFEEDWCFVTNNARDFRGPDDARGSSGEYACVELHAGLICLHGPGEGFTKAEQLEAFAAALDLLDDRGGDATNTLIEVTWSAAGVVFEVIDFPAAT